MTNFPLLHRCVDTVAYQYWALSIEKELGEGKPISQQKLSAHCPTEHQQKLLDNHHYQAHDLDGVFWCRRLNGKHRVRDKGHIPRVEKLLPGSQQNYEQALFDILKNPLAPYEELQQIKVKLKLTPKNKSAIRNSLTLDGLALRLIEYREKRLLSKSHDNHKKDKKEAIQLFLQLAADKPFYFTAGAVLEFLYVFFYVNDNLSQNKIDIATVIENYNEKSYLAEFFKSRDGKENPLHRYKEYLYEYLNFNRNILYIYNNIDSRGNSLMDLLEQVFPADIHWQIHPLWSILLNPLSTQDQLNRMKSGLYSYFKEKAFTVMEDGVTLKYRRLRNNGENQTLLNTFGMLALRLILYREQRISPHTFSLWPCDEAGTVLLFLRLATIAPLRGAADPALKALYIFFHFNSSTDHFKNIDNILKIDSTDVLMEEFFRRMVPDNRPLDDYMKSLSAYLKHHDCIMDRYGVKTTKNGKPCLISPLHAIDHYAHLWLQGMIPKSEILAPDSPYKNQVMELWQGTNHRLVLW